MQKLNLREYSNELLKITCYYSNKVKYINICVIMPIVGTIMNLLSKSKTI